MSRFLRLLAAYSVVLLVASCSGGGCSSCAGGALHPIHGEYPLTPETRIPHAMQIRLTDQGLSSVSTFAPDLFAGFLANGINVPRSSMSIGVGYATICPGNNCNLTVSLPTTPAPMVLSFVPTDQINAKVRVIIQGNIPISSCVNEVVGITGCNSDCSGSICVFGTCGGCANGPSPTINIDTTRGSYTYIGLETNVAIARDSHAQRLDYFRPDFVAPTASSTAAIQETPGETIENADLQCNDSVVCVFFSLLEGTITSAFTSQFGAALAPIQSALAATSMPDPPGCPAGTAPTGADSAHCFFPDGTQVPTLLGTQGTGNFGALLASFTPGLSANASYVIGAGDHSNDAEVSVATGDTGMTIDAFGAVISTQHSSCVPLMQHPALPTIPEWTNLRQNTIPGSQPAVTTDLSVGIAEDFINSALWNLWDAGLFCLGLNSRTSQMLTTGTFSALPQLTQLNHVTFPARNSALAVAMRPQNPPTVHVGGGTDLNTDPLMLVNFHSLALDFYAFSEERYVRFMTVTTDLSLPVNLMTDTGGLRPTLGMATTANAVVSNQQPLLGTTQASLGGVVASVIGTAVGQFAGSIPAIAIPSIPLPSTGGMSAGNINIQIPGMGGIQGLSEGTGTAASRYIALFANLQYVSNSGHIAPPHLETSLSFERIAYDPAIYTGGTTFTPDQLPHIRLHIQTPETFGHDVEYTYRVDGMTWSPWTRQTTVDVSSPSFIAQGGHHIEARARVIDEVDSVDLTPARVDFDFDTTPPVGRVERPDEHTLTIVATDDVVDQAQLQYSVQFDTGDQTEFTNQHVFEVPSGARHYEVWIRDTNGNTTHLSSDLTPLIIRGGPSTDAAACGCSTPGGRADGTGSLMAAVAAALFALSWTRRRRNGNIERAVTAQAKSSVLPPRFVLWTFVVLAWVGFGCQCGQSPVADGGMRMDGSVLHPDGSSPDSMMTPTCPTGQRYCSGHSQCVTATPTCNAMSCQAGYTPGMTPTFDDTACTWNCNCMPLPPLPQGMAGSFLDMVPGANSAVWFSAYSAGDPRSNQLYGDLVVGRWDTEVNSVDWTIVDGVPATGTVTGDPNGWRHGISDPGDDDGRWNSIALDSLGHPRVAYWDATHDQLKFASFDGTNWTVSVVDTTGSNGRYAALVMLPSDIPAVVYRAILPDPAMAGHFVAHVRFAKANNATPHQPTDWTVGDITTAPTQCRANNCATGQVCLQTTGVCTAPSGTCSTACTAAQSCIMGTCTAIYSSTWVEDYPPGIGLFNSVALDSSHRPQVVYYDRDRGNLLGVSMTSATAWGSPFIIDGETPTGADTGDRGMWASLVVTSNNTWHIGYVDAYNERVMYTTVTSGQAQAQPEVVDDGSGVGTTEFPDGHHIIGDSVDLEIDTLGNTRIVYQDSTAGTLRLAVRGTSGWTASVLDMQNHTGYWSRIRGSNIGVFWRNVPMDQFGVRLIPIP